MLFLPRLGIGSKQPRWQTRCPETKEWQHYCIKKIIRQGQSSNMSKKISPYIYIYISVLTAYLDDHQHLSFRFTMNIELMQAQRERASHVVAYAPRHTVESGLQNLIKLAKMFLHSYGGLFHLKTAKDLTHFFSLQLQNIKHIYSIRF